MAEKGSYLPNCERENLGMLDLVFRNEVDDEKKENKNAYDLRVDPVDSMMYLELLSYFGYQSPSIINNRLNHLRQILNKHLILDAIIAVLCLVSIILGIIDFELVYSNNHFLIISKNNSKYVLNVIRLIISILTISCIILNIISIYFFDLFLKENRLTFKCKI